MPHLSRRLFIKSGTASAIAIAAHGTGLSAAETDQPQLSSRFKFSLAAYSYRSLLGGKSPTLKMSDFSVSLRLSDFA